MAHLLISGPMCASAHGQVDGGGEVITVIAWFSSAVSTVWLVGTPATWFFWTFLGFFVSLCVVCD